MKNVFKALELNENDNIPTAMAKGAVIGWGKYTLGLGAVVSVLLIVGKCVVNKDELKNLEEEMGAE